MHTKPLAIVLTLLLTTAAARAADTDLHQAATQFRAYCVGSSTDHGERLLDDVELPKTSIAQAHKLLNTLKDDGSWGDVAYDSNARSSWVPFNHLTRVLSLTVYARRDQTDPAQSKAAVAAANKALAYWAQHDFKCPNWWYNDIGVPKILGTIALLLDQDLPPATREYITGTAMMRSKVGAMTGQNRVWLAGNGVMRGLLTNDDALVAKAADVIQREILVSPDEGIQPDWSFHQHGPQQQFGNYGQAFAMDNVRWAVVLRNTRYAVPVEKVRILRNYLLEGQNWITWRGSLDISACGRQLFPNSPRSKAGVMRAVMLTMSLVDTEFAPAYKAFATRNDPAVPDAPNDLLGTRAFYDSDYVLHRSTDLAVSLKMYSDRVLGGETVNSENLSGNHLADGATFFYRTGDEYADIFPVWNWRMIPGTTAVQDDSPLIWKAHSAKAKISPAPRTAPPAEKGEEPNEPPRSIFEKPPGTSFVGGLSADGVGCAAMDFQRDTLHAHKAWFFVNGTTLCVGADITAASDSPVVTTLNQCLLQGPIEIATTTGKRSLTAAEPQSIADVRQIEHAGLRYTFPEPATITLAAQPVTGNWQQVFDSPSTPRKDVTTPTFLLSLDHGRHPAAASYAYIVSPATRAEQPPLKLLANTLALQAAEIDGRTQIVFWTAGSVQTAAGTVKVDKPCLVALTPSGDTFHLSVADPTHTLKNLTIEVHNHPTAVPFPAGPDSGNTVNVPLSQR